MAKKVKFWDTEDPVHIQQSLFMMPGVEEGLEDFPPILRDREGILKILSEPQDGIGLDLEFSPKTGKPSILGVANRKYAGAVPWDAELARATVKVAEEQGVDIVGHSVLSADRPILEGALKTHTALTLWDDTMIRHYLCNPDFTKTPAKDEDSDDTGAIGFLNLWTMSSLYTKLPNWKNCRGKACEGPCPVHDPFGYCAIDSWAGLESKFGLVEEMRRKNIPEQLHDDLSLLSEITYKMEHQGIKVDRTYVADLEKNFEALKLEIFPIEVVNGKPIYTPFNPKSVKQVQEYFAAHGVELRETDKKSVKKALDKEAKRRGYDAGSLGAEKNLPEVLDSLFRLYEFKDAGKGLASWFDDKYIAAGDLIHPRFVVPGSCMGRMSSSKPNFTNIPARGFGSKVKQAIIPRDPSLDLVKADFSQLEMRIMLHYGGFDLKDLRSDPFAGLVERSKGALKDAAAFLHGTERDVAKSLVHANNYGEGVVFLTSKDLDKRKNEIASGALLVYRDWEYRGGVIGFTGGNLAERLFGNKSWESRKKALALQELVNEEFPWIRRLHHKIAVQIEEKKGIQLETGRFLPLYGNPEEDFKMGTAAVGQGSGADHMQSVMLRYYQEVGVIPLLVVHDEATFEIPKDWSNQRALDFMQLMNEPTKRLQGFWCPAQAKRGPTWGQMKGMVA